MFLLNYNTFNHVMKLIQYFYVSIPPFKLIHWENFHFDVGARGIISLGKQVDRVVQMVIFLQQDFYYVLLIKIGLELGNQKGDFLYE